MWSYEEDDRYVDPQVQAADLAKLKELTEKAEVIKTKIRELKSGLVDEFMEFQPALTKYQYNREINNAVYDFSDTLGVHDYDSSYNFWLPSNIGC